MKGKKTDSEFLSTFISKCINDSIFDQQDIANKAKLEINNIDTQIKLVEKLKIRRSKLLDVVALFEKSTNNHKEEIKILSLFKLPNTPIYKFICKSIKNSNIEIKLLHNKEFSQTDIIFCIKQLIENKIIVRLGDSIMKGDMYNDYMKFVYREI